jgi:large subunit ribosomal protein L25
MSEFPSIDVVRRAEQGKAAAKKIRNQGAVPGVVYGAGKEPVPIRLDRRKLLEAFRGGATENTVFLLRLEESGQERHAMIREMQVDPQDRRILHVDFQRILMNQKIRVQVPIELQGVAYGVKTEGGVLDFVNRTVEVECLPDRIPHHLPVDVSNLHVNQHLEARDLQLPEGVALIDPPERVIAAVAHTKAADAAETTAAPEELIEAEKAEPEVIKKGKTTEEEK